LRELGSAPQVVSERALCLLHGSEIANRSGNTREGVERARSAERVLQGSPVRWHLEGLNVLINLATVLGDAGKFREADQHFQEASALMSELGYDDSQKAAKLFNDWGLTLAYDGRQLEAERIYRRALDISRSDGGSGAAAPVLLFNYATLLRELGRSEEAATYLEEASEKARSLDDNILADDAELLKAEMNVDAHEFAKANRILNELEPRLRRRYAPEHYVFAEVSSARSGMALAQGDLPMAWQFAGNAVAVDEASIRRIGQCGAYLPTLLVRRARVELQIGQAESAATDARRALEMLGGEREAGIPSSNVGLASLVLAQALQSLDRQDEAQSAAQRAYANLQTTLGSDHADTRLSRELADARLPSH